MGIEHFDHAGVSIAFRRDGTRGAQPILLMHGLSGSSATYDGVVAALGPDLDIFRLDHRGHGNSDRAPGTYTMPFYAGDAAAFIEEAIGRPAVVAGHSLGGVTAHAVTTTRPDLVTAAFLEDPPLYFGDQSLFAKSIFATIFPVLAATMRKMHADGASRDEVREFVANAPSPAGGVASDHATPDGIEARVDAFLLCDPDVWEPAIHGGALSGFDSDAAITCPLTVLRADPAMGPAFFPDHADRFRRAVPHAKIVLIEGAPHGIHAHKTATERYLANLRELIASAPIPA